MPDAVVYSFELFILLDFRSIRVKNGVFSSADINLRHIFTRHPRKIYQESTAEIIGFTTKGMQHTLVSMAALTGASQSTNQTSTNRNRAVVLPAAVISALSLHSQLFLKCMWMLLRNKNNYTSYKVTSHSRGFGK